MDVGRLQFGVSGCVGGDGVIRNSGGDYVYCC